MLTTVSNKEKKKETSLGHKVTYFTWSSKQAQPPDLTVLDHRPGLLAEKRISFFFCLPGADVISFDGHGVISYRFRSKKMKIVKEVISLKFITTAGDGVLLHGEGQQGDYISLELRRERLQLSINLGSRPQSVWFQGQQKH